MISNSFLFANESNESYLELFLKQTNDYRKYIHKTLVSSSSNIDNYFFEEKNLKNINYTDTYAHLELSAYKTQDEDFSFDQSLKIKLKLPKLKDRFNLMFESDEERSSKDFVENHKKTQDYNLSLLYNKLLDGNIDFKTKIGLKIHSSFDPFIKIEAKKIWENIYGLDLILSQSLKESVEKKLENTTYFHITKPINRNLFLHNYNEYYWHSENSKDTEFYHTIYLNQLLSKKNHLTYQIDTNIDNIDTNMKIKRYSGKLKFRHYVKNWLYTDLIPENYYKEDQDFKPRYALRLNIGMNFNKSSYR